MNRFKSLLILSLVIAIGFNSYAEPFSSAQRNTKPSQFSQLSETDQLYLKRGFFEWLVDREHLGNTEVSTAKNLLNLDTESFTADLKVLPCNAQKHLLFGLIVDAKNSLNSKETNRAKEIKREIVTNCTGVEITNAHYNRNTFSDDDRSYDDTQNGAE